MKQENVELIELMKNIESEKEVYPQLPKELLDLKYKLGKAKEGDDYITLPLDEQK